MSQDHWDSIYRTRSADDLAWHEPLPSTLPDVLARSTPADPVIDVGGGAGTLALELVRHAYTDITVLDISEHALAASRAALWEHTGVVRWIHADVTRFTPARRWRLWHDRAVFHFLTDERDRAGYRAAAAAAVEPGGTLIVSTFGPTGPDRCAGLPVRRYDIGSLGAEFAPEFEFVDGHDVRPASQRGDRRPYVLVLLRRLPNQVV